MRAPFKIAVAVLAIALIPVPVASANTAVALVSGYLDVQTDAAGSNILIAKTGASTFTVTDPAGNLTGAGPNCTPAGPAVTITCQNVTKESTVSARMATTRSPSLRAPTLIATLSGSNGADTLTGGDFTDDMQGGDGNDTLNGGAGNDYLRSGTGSDHVNGGGGNDRIEQGSGSMSGDVDVLNGDADEDFIWSQGDGTAQFNGGPATTSSCSPASTSQCGRDGGRGRGGRGGARAGGSTARSPSRSTTRPTTGRPGSGTSNVHSDVENIDRLRRPTSSSARPART